MNRQAASFPALPGYQAEFGKISTKQTETRLQVEIEEEVDILAFSKKLSEILAQYPEQEDTFTVRWEQKLCTFKGLIFASMLDHVVSSDETQIVGKIGNSLVQYQKETGLFRALLRESTAQGMLNSWELVLNRLLENAQSLNLPLPADGKTAEGEGKSKAEEGNAQKAAKAEEGEPSDAEATLMRMLNQLASPAIPVEKWADWEDHQLQVAFQLGRQMVAKLAMDQDFSQKVAGYGGWDAKQLVKTAVGMQYSHIPEAQSSYAKTGLTMLLDISDSCSAQAEMFAAIAAGAANGDVTIYVGGNGFAYTTPLKIGRRFSSYASAKEAIEREIDRIPNDMCGFSQFVANVQSSRLIIFGDWDGKSQYEEAAKKNKNHGWYWFCNEDEGNSIPRGWTTKNYFPNIMEPQALSIALRKVR